MFSAFQPGQITPDLFFVPLTSLGGSQTRPALLARQLAS